jgi:hypothetical protein
MENVTPLKPQTDEEKFEEQKNICSTLFFRYGQLAYQIKCHEQELGDLEIQLKNANTVAHNLNKKIMAEKAEKLKVEQQANEGGA